MTFWMIFPAIALWANVHLLTFVIGQKRHDPINNSCIFFVHFLMLYIIHDSIFFWSPMPESWIIPVLRFGILFFSPIPFLLINFIHRILGIRNDAVYYISFFFIFIFVPLCLFTDMFYKGYSHAPWGRAAVPGVFHFTFGILMFFVVVYTGIQLFIAMRKTEDDKAHTISRSLFFGNAAMLVVGSITNVIMPDVFQKCAIFPLASSSTIFFTIAIFVAMKKHNFLLSDYQQLEQTFSYLFEHIDRGIILLSGNNRITQINRAASAIFETEGIVQNTPIGEFIAGFDPDKKYDAHEMQVTVNEKEKILLLTLSPCAYPNLDIASIMIIQDISIRKKIHEAVQESEEKWHALVEHVPDVILRVDTDGVIRFVNHSFSGIPAEQLVGKSIFDFEEPERRGRLREIISRVINEGVTEKYESRYRIQDGANLWVEVHAGPIISDNKVVAITLITTDITQRKQAEKEIIALNENLEQLVDERTAELRESQEHLRRSEKMEAIGQLAGGIAHDFNNQLTGILTCAEMLKSSLSENKDLQEMAKTVVTAARRASHLTAQMLTFARKGKYQSIPVNIHSVIDDVISLLEHSIDKSIQIKKQLETHMPVVVGDPGQFQNALLNLAINARDAMPDGGVITFSTKVKALTEEICERESLTIPPGQYVRIRVSDNGVGMDEETQKHIFEPFFTTKEPGKGTGMGLAAVYGTVETHKGAITVNSKRGNGSTFTLYFPLLDPAKHHITLKDTSILPIIGKARILIVDDEDIVRDTLKKVLKRLGYSVHACRNGREAVKFYKKSWQEIDLVLLDMIMPKMGGKEAFHAMKKINPAIKVFLISGYSLSDQTRYLLDEGVLGFIQKPYSVGELSQRIAEELRK